MAVVSFFLACFVLSHLQLHFVSAENPNESQMSCPKSFDCGKFGSIPFPFSNSTYPQCGLCTVNCDHHPFPLIQLENEGPWFDIKGIDIQSNDSISEQIEVEILDQKLQSYLDNKNCLAFSNLTFPNSPSLSFTIPNNLTMFKCNKGYEPNSKRTHELFKHFPTETCEGFELFYKHRAHQQFLPPDLQQQCLVVQLPMNQPKNTNFNTNNPFELLTATFVLQFHLSKDCVRCGHRGGQCQNHNQTFGCLEMQKEERTLNSHTNSRAKFRLILATGVASIVVVITIILLCFFSKKVQAFGKLRTKYDKNIQTFLKNFESLVPLRYSYSEVKKIASSFKNKLGEGGYGSVFKGKLKNGQFVAVKLLKESKGNGEEFVNEVMSISRTSHVNIVTLLGFCYEGHKRALIYEFMPNGSLEKFIYKRSSSMTEPQLGWETLYKIAVGIAKGLEYLHLGCNTRILHLDIKPHNILLDQDFCPKISDFGLSKLCLNKESTISRLPPRGTIGYIAPEVFCRNFGVVSSKSDVYSYGMMILELVGEREDIDVGVNHTSETYFPEWIYKHLELDEEIGLHGITNEVGNERKKKMAIVGLWCIQTNPSNRPSMSKVVEMLEGSLESLQIPPKPFLFTPPRAPKDSSTIGNVTSDSTCSIPSLK